MNYAWNYNSHSEVRQAQDVLESWTHELGEAGMFQENITNWKFWYNVQGFVCTLEFANLDAYNAYKAYETEADVDFYSLMSFEASDKRKSLFTNRNISAFEEFTGVDSYPGVPNTDIYGTQFFGIVNGGLPPLNNDTNSSQYDDIDFDDLTFDASDLAPLAPRQNGWNEAWGEDPHSTPVGYPDNGCLTKRLLLLIPSVGIETGAAIINLGTSGKETAGIAQILSAGLGGLEILLTFAMMGGSDFESIYKSSTYLTNLATIAGMILAFDGKASTGFYLSAVAVPVNLLTTRLLDGYCVYYVDEVL